MGLMGHSMSCWCWSSKDFIFITERFADSLLVFRSLWNLTFSQLLHVRVWLGGYGWKAVFKKGNLIFEATWMKSKKEKHNNFSESPGRWQCETSLYIHIYVSYFLYGI